MVLRGEKQGGKLVIPIYKLLKQCTLKDIKEIIDFLYIEYHKNTEYFLKMLRKQMLGYFTYILDINDLNAYIC